MSDEGGGVPGRRSVLVGTSAMLTVGALSACEAPAPRSGPTTTDFASLRPGGVLELQPRTYDVRSEVKLPEGVTVNGNGAVVRLVAASSSVLRVDSGTTLSDLTVATTARGHALVQVVRGATGVTLSKLVLRGSGAEESGIDTEGETRDLHIVDVDIFAVRNGIQIVGASRGVRITGGTIDTWSTRGIRVQGNGEGASEGLSIADVSITGATGAGGSRQPITIRSSAQTRHRDIRISGCRAVGRGTAFADSANPGTGDQFSVVNADGVVIEDCHSVDGGERGINVANATDVVVRNNVVKGSDTVGIGIGARGRGIVRNLLVEGNDVEDSGTATLEDTTDYSLSGIRVTDSTDGVVRGNVVRKSFQGPRPRYGIVVDGCTNVRVSDSRVEGSFARAVLDGGGNTGLVLRSNTP